MEWDYKTFGRWLRRARVAKLPVLSQDKVAESIGTTQAKISRWEQERPGTDAPSLEECLHLADLFGVNFLELAKLCGRWNDRLQQRVLVDIAAGDLSDAPVAQTVFADFDAYRARKALAA